MLFFVTHMNSSFKHIIIRLRQIVPEIPADLKDEYASYRFQRNNLMILLLSLFLAGEQIFYGAFVSEHGNPLRCVYFITSIAMMLFVSISYYFHRHSPPRVNLLHRLFELSLSTFGIWVALARFLLIEADINVFHIPTVYIAVIYAVAVIYVFSVTQSFVLYTVSAMAVIFLMPKYHPEIRSERYVADIISNGIIAFIIAVTHYRSFIKQFMNRKEIEKKNSELADVNQQISIINAELHELSVTDVLTGMFNRRKLDEVIRSASVQAIRYGLEFSVIIMDIDHFKNINDTHGHDAGDIVLKQVAGLIHDNTREVDTCGRWGGEEFMIICPEINVGSAALFAERLRERIESHSFDIPQRVTASLGVAAFTECGSQKSLLKTADARLYSAKRAGRNMVKAEE